MMAFRLLRSVSNAVRCSANIQATINPARALGTFVRQQQQQRQHQHRQHQHRRQLVASFSSSSDTRPNDDPLSSDYRKRAGAMLRTMDKVRQLLALESDIQVPSIVVVGDQSSGKSSVLELLSGVRLPSGRNTVTRVPIEIRLRACPKGADEHAVLVVAGPPGAERADGSSPAFRRLTLADVEQELRNAMDRLVGEDGHVVDKPLALTVYRHEQDEMTLIDLPGIVRLEPGETTTVKNTIEQMYKRYMTPEQAVLLNVMSAHTDIQTCESLQLSRNVDRDSRRTLLCITRADQKADELPGIMTQAKVVCNGQVFCVRCRTDKEQDLTVAEVRTKEQELFRCHASLRNLDDLCKGVGSLSKALVDVQAERIREYFQPLRQQVEAREREYLAQQMQFDGIPTTEVAARTFVRRAVRKAVDGFRADMRGDGQAADFKLCAELAKVDQEFAAKMQTLNSAEYLVSKDFRAKIKDEVAWRSGADGHPGTINPLAAVWVVKQLLKEVPAPLSGLVQQYTAVVESKWCWALEESFQQVSRNVIQNQLKDAARAIILKRSTVARERVQELAEWEETTSMVALDPDYAVQEERALHGVFSLRDTPTTSFFWKRARHQAAEVMPHEVKVLLSLTTEALNALKKLEGWDRELGQFQVRTLVYWANVQRRLTDTAVLSVRHHLVRCIVKNDQLLETLDDAVDAIAKARSGGLLDAIVTPQQHREMDVLNIKLGNVKQARQLLRDQELHG
eukprot:m.332811 g.332811  ORF g.332811 m.332811 type:complete len:737 (+) comp19779_c2_seq1:42-2252(+)